VEIGLAAKVFNFVPGSVRNDGPHNARLRDISESGLAFFLDRNIEEMTILEVSFDLPTGVVVRSRKISPAVDHFASALFFNGLDESSREALKAFIKDTAC